MHDGPTQFGDYNMIARPNKYRAKRTTVYGIEFHSKAEARRYAELRVLEAAGKISRLELQPVFPIVIDGEQLRYPGSNRSVKAVMDFAYFEDGKRIVLDVKGCDNKFSKLKRALVQHIYKIEVRVT
jgi:hypothetical protein